MAGAGGGGAQALKRIPLIKFPQRHPKASGSAAAAAAAASKSQEASAAAQADLAFFSSSKASSMTVGGKASLQPKRTPVSNEEIEAILLGGCI